MNIIRSWFREWSW